VHRLARPQVVVAEANELFDPRALFEQRHPLQGYRHAVTHDTRLPYAAILPSRVTPRSTVIDPAEAAAREAIRDTISRYNHAGDRGRLDELVRAFAPWGVMAIAGEEELHGRRAIRQALAGVSGGAAARSGPASPAFMRHHVSSVRIEMLGAGRARASSYYLVVTTIGPDHSGLYRDDFVRVGEEWLIAHRRVSVDWLAPDSPLAARAQRVLEASHPER